MPSEFWAAILGAFAAGGVGYLAQRAAARRALRAELLCRDVAALIRWVEGHIHELGVGHGPFQLSEGARLASDIQRQAVAAGSRDLRAVRRLGRHANVLIDLDNQVWFFKSIGVELKMNGQEAIRSQHHLLRMYRRTVYEYEGWLRRRLALLGSRGTHDTDGPFDYPTDDNEPDHREPARSGSGASETAR